MAKKELEGLEKAVKLTEKNVELLREFQDRFSTTQGEFLRELAHIVETLEKRNDQLEQLNKLVRKVVVVSFLTLTVCLFTAVLFVFFR